MSGRHSKKNDIESNKNKYNDYAVNRKNTNKRTKNSLNNNKLGLVFKIIAVIYIIISIFFYISVLRMDLLPILYVTVFTIAEIAFTFAITVGLIKTHKTYKLNILCLIIAVIMSTAYIYASTYVNATTDFLGSVFTEFEETDEYYVVARKNSNYEKIEDIKNEDVYTFQVEDDIKEQVGNKVKITLRKKESLSELGNDLLNEKIDIILVSANQHSMLEEDIEKYKDNTKIIYTLTHKIKKTKEVASEDSKYKINDGVFNVYISGIDTSGRISNVSRSDANIIATVNTKKHEILLTSIPRDYYVTLHSKQAKDKLTHSGIYGISETVTTVEDLLDIDINYYIRVNFTTVIKLVDTLDGVDVYSDYNFNAGGYSFYKGYNHVNGQQALAFSRERHSFASGDNQRVKNQQHVIEAIIKKALSNAILTKYSSILNSLSGSFQTNIEQSDISKLVKDQLQSMSSWTVKNNSLEGTGASKTTYSMGNQYLYVMIPNETSVENAKAKINNMLEK